MFDLGWSELFIVGLITLLVVGPKELPRVLRTISQVMAKARGLAREFQSSVDEMVRESELDDLKKEIHALKGQADIGGQMRTMMDEAARDFENELKATEKPKAVAETDPTIDPVAAANEAATKWPIDDAKTDKPLIPTEPAPELPSSDGPSPASQPINADETPDTKRAARVSPQQASIS